MAGRSLTRGHHLLSQSSGKDAVIGSFAGLLESGAAASVRECGGWRCFLLSLGVVASLVTSGCGSVPLGYEYTKPDHTRSAGSSHLQLAKPSLSIAPIRDSRNDTDIDDRLTADITDTLAQIIRREIAITDAFAHVATVDHSGSLPPPDLPIERQEWVLEAELLQAEWDTPYYALKKFGNAAAGLLLGWVGGLVSGAIPSDMVGVVRMRIRVRDLDSGETVFAKEYVGTHVDYESLAFVDRSSVRVPVVSKAIADMIGELQSDLSQLSLYAQKQNGTLEAWPSGGATGDNS